MNSKEVFFGSYLKEKRILAGLSQVDVASKLGYTTAQFISNWERGISIPPFDILRELALIYKIDADSLFQATLETKIEGVTKEIKRKYYGKSK